MAENSKIEWTDHTFNPWEGCAKVSEGCKHCYAEARAKRFGTVQWGPQGQRRRTSAANWKKPLKWNRDAEAFAECTRCGWRGVPATGHCPCSHGAEFNFDVRPRVFCASLADVFEIKTDQDLDEWRHDLFSLIQKTPNLDWLLLTKRPENVMDYLQFGWGTDLPDNVWIGTSVENQEQADKRIPELLEIPARVRFLSMEPLLEPVDLEWCAWCGGFGKHDCYDEVGTIDWVIVGGESGTHARPMHPEWVRSIRDRCVEAGVPFFFKQWGEWIPYDEIEHYEWGYAHSDDEDKWNWITVDGRASSPIWRKDLITTVIKIGKKNAGRLLDGKEWDEFPQITKEQTA